MAATKTGEAVEDGDTKNLLEIARFGDIALQRPRRLAEIGPPKEF